jgi:hypothetical protein
MALTRLDNLYSSKTGKYLYVSPDDFNATDELDNRGNSPLRPFKTIQRAFIEVARYSYLPNAEDRFDQFSIMLMPGNHYIDNRPGVAEVTNKEPRYFDGADLIEANRQEIIDRAFAQIAIDYNEVSWGTDWVVPGDVTENSLNRFFDAYRLIQKNRTEIIQTAYQGMLDANPGFVVPGTPGVDDIKCQRDIGYFIDAISLDVCLGGGNKYTRKFVQNYFNAAGNSWLSNTLEGEEQQSIDAFAAARDEMNAALTNQLTYKDLSITVDPVTNDNESVNSCANVRSLVFSLSQIVLDVIEDGNLNDLPGETSAPAIGDGQNICKRDIGYVVDAIISDLKTGGNSNIVQAARSYFDRNGLPISNGLIGEEAQSIVAFNAARDMMRKAVSNRLYSKDLTLLAGPSVANGSGLIQPLLPSGNEMACVDVQDTISSLILILTTVISDGNLSSLDEIEITGDIPIFNYNQALEEWNDNSILDLSNPDNVLYKFNATTGGAIVPRGCSLIGYDLRRTIVRPLYVPDPADGTQERTSIFNLTGGCYLWQFTIKDGDLSANSPLFDSTANVGKVYYQAGNTLQLAVPEYSHHKICIMEYADGEELDRYYTKVGRAFSRFQPTIDDGDFEALVQENRIVGPLSDTRRIESIKITDSTPAGTITVQITTKIDHGYFVDQYIAILNNGLSDQLNGTFKVTRTNVDGNPKVFEYTILGSISALGNSELESGATYTVANGLDANAVSQAEIDSVESASPYVFNCSIRSTWGMCGMWADGSKATGFKSMVVAQYTGVSLQKDDRAFIRYDRFTNTWNQASLTDAFATVPYHTKGDAYWKDDWRNFHIRASDDAFIQCVSVFAVGFFDHFLMESGGDMSITNSNSNFGNTSLHAVGFKGFAFNQDKGGYITDIIPPRVINTAASNELKIQYYTLDILASNDQDNHTRVYIGSDAATDPANRPAASVAGYRIGAKQDEKLYVKLDIGTAYSTLEPTGFTSYTASLETLNPSGIQINNRAQDAADRVEDNKEFIQSEAYEYIIAKYPELLTNTNITISKCKRDIGYFVDAVVSDLRLGGNINTVQAAEGYFVGGSLAYINSELIETIDALDYVKNLSIAAMRNFDYLRTTCLTTAGSPIVNVGDTTGLVIGMKVEEYTTNSFLNGKLIESPNLITSNISSGTYIKNIIDSNTIELGTFGSKLDQGASKNALQNSSNAWLYFTLEDGAWYDQHSVELTTDPSLIQATEYPECVDIATTITQYFDDIKLTLNQGPNTVVKIEPEIDYAGLTQRATIFTINTGGSSSNPHTWETGTPVKLIPRARAGTNPDKRLIRLPNGFETNTKYYVIAPGRKTEPYDYSGTTYFNGADQTKLMLAATKENAAAGIYIYSPETESIDPDVEIVVEQYVLDDVYDLHKYKCNFTGGDTQNIETDIAHIFDLPNAAVPPQKVFFRVAEDILDSELPQISGQGNINPQQYYYVRYVTSKKFTIHTTHADAISGNNEVSFVGGTGKNFYVFANKRRSPLLFDAEYSIDGNTSGLWYLQVQDESSGLTPRTDSILTRFHDITAYGPGTGKIRTLDSWYTRVQDARSKEDRVYRLRYVIPKYLETVRDPLNGFVLKIRTDDKRRLVPQRIVLAPVAGNTQNTAVFKNPVGFQETIGLTQNEYVNDLINPIDISVFEQSPEKRVSLYDPYASPKVVETESNIAFTIQSARKVTNNYLEIIAFDHTIINQSLKNETFTVVEISQPQGGSGAFNSALNAEIINWSGFSSGSAIVHSYKTVGNRYFLVLRIIEGSIQYSPVIATSFSQINNPFTITANLVAKANSVGDPEGKDKSDRKDYLYRVDGANVYTLVPGDFINDDTGKRYQIVSVEDVGNLEDTFYIFDINEVQERIAGQQDGIYYLTCVRGNISPFPTNPGVGDNFKNYKFSQPISQLYPQNYKNDPVWFKQLNPAYNDAPIAISAADNYVHGLVTINDSKRSETKEVVYDMIEQPALSRYDFVKSEELVSVTPNPIGGSNIIEAQEGNATSGSENRRIPISGDSEFPLEQKLYVELRRPSIARSGNHTFEYLGFGPGNYSTGFPLRQEVVLSDTQDFYAQSKREDGGIVFYTGLNSNGDLYIGNRKINAITGEETFLEQAILEESEDDSGDNLGSLVTTFDVPVTFNDRIVVEGDANFNNPVTITVDADEGVALRVTSVVDDELGDDISLSNKQHQNNNDGDITLGKNRINSAIYGIIPRQILGNDGQSYSIRTHYSASTGPTNITPDQNKRFNILQEVSYSTTQKPENGDILLKGKEVGLSGSLGWIYANYFTVIGNSNIQNIVSDGTSLTINWIPTVTNQQLNVVPGSKLRISSFNTNANLNGTWTVLSSGFNASANFCKIVITILPANGTIYNIPSNSTFEISRANWKEYGVIGSETLRTNTETFGSYKLGINTIARASDSAYTRGFVDSASENNIAPRANLDVVGETFISGKNVAITVTGGVQTKTETFSNNALLVGGDSLTPANAATLRVATTNNGRVGINATNTQLDRSLVVVGNGRITGDFRFESDIEVNGGDITTTNTTFNFVNQNTLTAFNAGANATSVALFNTTTGNQTIDVGTSALTTTFNLHTGSTNSTINLGVVSNTLATNRSNITIGGAFNNPPQSIFRVRNYRTIFDGRLTIRGGFIEVDETVNSFTMFPDGLTELKIAGSAGTVEIGGVAGRTTIRHGLKTLGSAIFEADITQNGGYRNSNVGVTRNIFGTINIVQVSRSGNIARIVTEQSHQLTTGDTVEIKCSIETFNTATPVAVTVVNSTTFTYANTGTFVATSTAATGRVLRSVGQSQPTGSLSNLNIDYYAVISDFAAVMNVDAVLNNKLLTASPYVTDNDPVKFTDVGNLAGVNSNDVYYVKSSDTSGFTLSSTINGPTLTISLQSGTTSPGTARIVLAGTTVDTEGDEYWGSVDYQNEDGTYTLPINNPSNIASNQYLLIGTEIVRVVSDPTPTRPFTVNVLRAQDGTAQVAHADGERIVLLNKQENASYVFPNPVSPTSTTVNIGELSAFLRVNDIFRLNKGTQFDEFVRISAINTSDAQTFSITNGDIGNEITPKNPLELFKVISTSGNTHIIGDVIIGYNTNSPDENQTNTIAVADAFGFNSSTSTGSSIATSGGGNLKVHNSIELSGNTSTTTPGKQYFVITNGSAPRFYVESATGNTRLYNGANLTVFKDSFFADGTFDKSRTDIASNIAFQVIGSTGDTKIAGTLRAGDDFTVGTLQNPANAETISNIFTTRFSVDAQTGTTFIGRHLTINGLSSATPAESVVPFAIDNLGVNGTNEFRIKQDRSIDSFGEDRFYNKNGGRKTIFVSTQGNTDATAVELRPNLQYAVRPASTLILKLPSQAVTGDTIRIVDVGGALSFSVNLVVRAPSNVQIQGKLGGTTLGGLGSEYSSGELVVNTPNAAFGLIYIGDTDGDGNGVPGEQQGWFLMEI